MVHKWCEQKNESLDKFAPAEPLHLLHRVLSTGGEVVHGLLDGGEEDPVLVKQVHLPVHSPLEYPAPWKKLAGLEQNTSAKLTTRQTRTSCI